MNTLKVGLLLTALTAGFVLIGQWIGGTGGMVIALVLATAMNAGSYWFSDHIILRMTGAVPLDERTAPSIFPMTRRLAERAEIPVPRLYLVPDPQPNAFATGRAPDRGVVALHQGLLDLLDAREVEGVIAHEIAHIKHRDTLIMTVAATLAGAVMTLVHLAHWTALVRGNNDSSHGTNLVGLVVAALVAPVAAGLIQMAVSRTREYAADRTAAELIGSATGLIGALKKLQLGARMIPSRSMRPQTAHLAIVNPLFGGSEAFTRLFATHPPMTERVARLRIMEQTLSGAARKTASREPVLVS